MGTQDFMEYWVEREMGKTGGIADWFLKYLEFSKSNVQFWQAVQSFEDDGYEVSAQVLEHSWDKAFYVSDAGTFEVTAGVNKERIVKSVSVQGFHSSTVYSSRLAELLQIKPGSGLFSKANIIGEVRHLNPDVLYNLWLTYIADRIVMYAEDNVNLVGPDRLAEFKVFRSKVISDAQETLRMSVQQYVDETEIIAKSNK